MNGWRSRAEPWRDGDLITVSVTSLTGLAVVMAGWFGASGTAEVATQAAWLNVAVAGFTISAAGQCLWLLRLRRAIGERRVALVALSPAPEPGDAEPSLAPAPDPTTALELVRAAGMDRVHRPDCPLVADKPVTPASPGDGAPCGVCTP